MLDSSKVKTVRFNLRLFRVEGQLAVVSKASKARQHRIVLGQVIADGLIHLLTTSFGIFSLVKS